MRIVEIRGHHLESIERALRRNEPNSLRNIGEYDYFLYFQKHEEHYNPTFARNCFRVYNQLFMENPHVKLIDSPDAICKACPYLGDEGVECNNPWAGTGFEDDPKCITELTKEGDIKAITYFGFNLGDEVRFSEILRHIIDRSWLKFGYESLEAFKRDFNKIFHPKIVALYNK